MLKAPSRALASDEMFYTVKMAKTPEPAVTRKFSVLFWTVVNAEVRLFIKAWPTWPSCSDISSAIGRKNWPRK